MITWAAWMLVPIVCYIFSAIIALGLLSDDKGAAGGAFTLLTIMGHVALITGALSQ